VRPRIIQLLALALAGCSVSVSFASVLALSPIVRPSPPELLVGGSGTLTITRYLAPLTTPTPHGTIVGSGLSTSLGKMVFVDDELWIVNAGNSNVDRLGFDISGAVSMTGSFALLNGRGIAFDPATRNLYISRCCGTNQVLHYTVGLDHSVVAKPTLAGNGLSNPHGVLLTPWGELFVANAGDASVLRFTLDALGNPTANGRITGNGLATPIDLLMAPWGELFVTNQGGTQAISRFTFDPSHGVSPHGTLAIPAVALTGWAALY
jgi:DNA-binding beta-propeller fold protein YncE